MLAASANVLWWSSNAGRYASFLRALHNPRAAQTHILRRYLRVNADTQFGRRYGFARIRSIAEFQDRVPLSEFEDYAEYIDHIAAGEARVLTRDPVKSFVPTSGSTVAEKLVPYTNPLVREFSRAIGPWVFDLFRRDPRLLDGRAYWSISPVAQRPRHVGAILVGFEEDSAYVGGFAKRLVDAALAVPGAVRHERDINRFRRVTLVHLLSCRDLRLISVWNPSFLTLLTDAMAQDWDPLLREVNRLDCRRAAQLRRIGPHPEEVWPNLRLISCWMDAAASLAVPALRRWFPRTPLQAKGLVATEGIVSVPFARLCPLAVRSHFFEFLDARGNALLADQLARGETYSVVLTTAGGLYRYRLHDRVTVDGFVARTPSLRFVGKDSSVSDLRGEKLAEPFVVQVLESLRERFNLSIRFAMLAPEPEADPPHYLLIYDGSDPPAHLPHALDQQLMANPHYRYCRRLGQLAPARVLPVEGDAQAIYCRHLADQGRRLGNIKPTVLSLRGGWREVFDARAPAPGQAPMRHPAPRPL